MMTRTERLKIKKMESKVKQKRLIRLLLALFVFVFIGITSSGTYAYFTSSEKTLPAPVAQVPVYNEFQVEYTDHSESQSLDDGITLYFDVSNLLKLNPSWNSNIPNIHMYFQNSSGVKTRDSIAWSDSTYRLKFDSISTINPTDISKCKTYKNIGSTRTLQGEPLGGITWSGVWLKCKLPNSVSDLKAGDTYRAVIIHVGETQTANNIRISNNVKEIYIRAGVGASSNATQWEALEINY